MTSSVRVVVLNYNGGAGLRRCVEHLLALDWPPERLDIVVVDNASSDSSVDAVEGEPRVRVIRNPENTGFPANNLALGDLDGIDHVALVNPDAFVEPGWLAPLVAALDSDERIGAACPKIVFDSRYRRVEVELKVPVSRRRWAMPVVELHDATVAGASVIDAVKIFDGNLGTIVEGGSRRQLLASSSVVGVPVTDPEADLWMWISADRPADVSVDGRTARIGREPVWIDCGPLGPGGEVVQNAGSAVGPEGFGSDRGFGDPDDGRWDSPTDVDAWCGGGVVLRAAYLADVGLFDERFFLYYEDTDLSWRGRARGWRYRYVPEARVRHVHAASTVEGSAVFAHHVDRNRLWMVIRNADAAEVARTAFGYVRATVGLFLATVVVPVLRRRRPSAVVVRRRLAVAGAVLGALPRLVRERRALRARRISPVEELRTTP